MIDDDDNEQAGDEYKFSSKTRLPKVPDLSDERMKSTKRPSPFILDDFKGSWAYRIAKP